MSTEHRPPNPEGRTPIYLFADSQLLFWRLGGRPLLETAAVEARQPPRAAYIGASNGDRSDYYDIFVGAMQLLGIQDLGMVRATFPTEDQRFLEGATLVVLAGGDVETGWRAFQSSGLDHAIHCRWDEGATLVGISAGAVQLGLAGCLEMAGHGTTLFDTFQLVPCLIGVHEEADNWRRLRQAVLLTGGQTKGIGIPLGGGMVFYPDGRVDAVRRPLAELSLRGDSVIETILSL